MVWIPWFFLFPALLLLGLTAFWPLLQAIGLSFTQFDLFNPPQWQGLANYQYLWHDLLFWKALANTLLFAFTAVPLLVILPLGLAILVNRVLPGIRLFRVVYYLPVIFSVVVAGIAWKWLYAENGLLNRLLSVFLGRSIEIHWLTDPRLALVSIAAVTVWKGLGYYMVIYLGGLQGIPTPLYEAAALDGAEGWRRHWWITLPLMQPYLFLVAVLSTIAAMKVFEEVYVMSRGGPVNSTLTLVYYLYEQGITRLNMGYAAAMGAVLLVLGLGLSLLVVQVFYRRQF